MAILSAHLRPLAFYLPQFHPIPENDASWGPGFTEWTNVTRAQPQFEGHYQPHLPAHLGFYDLRLADARIAQADLAREHGVHGFVYYHYWFHGRRLLGRPFDEVLASKAPDFPFCLCWANENWTRRWDGGDETVLVQQAYSDADDRAHIRWLARAFEDPRYIRVDGKPLFIVYRAGHLPDARVTTETWRQEAREVGLGELYLCRVESFPTERGDPTALGFDAAIEFQPDWVHLDSASREVANHRVYDYAEVMARMLAKPDVPHRRFPCVSPSWDNSARRAEGAAILDGASPELYEQWLASVVSQFVPYSDQENLLFINAWNEWAEGNHLEPCQRWGLGYLEATARALGRRTRPHPWLAASVEALRHEVAEVEAGLIAPPPAPDARELFLTEVYNVASHAAQAGDSDRSLAIFQLICELALPGNADLAGKAHYKRAQLAATDDEARALLERCLVLYPEHLDARRQLEALTRSVRG